MIQNSGGGNSRGSRNKRGRISLHRIYRGRVLGFLVLVCVPALVAGILFSRMDRENGGRYLQDTVSLTASSGTDSSKSSVKPLSIRLFGREGEKKDADPIRKIAFTAGGDVLQQRSLPVLIDAPAGSGADGQVWAVFLPAEMAEHPHVVFNDYKSVSFEAAGAAADSENSLAGDSSGGSSRDPSGDSSGNSSGDSSGDSSGNSSGAGGSGARAYASGDEVSGLENGSVFTVRMTDADGGVSEQVLYVYSCSDTATMYLDTESGSMDKVDGDETKSTSETAQYLVFWQDGSRDSTGRCSVSGRGNSTWSRKKKPYNLDLEEKRGILGMEECKKLCLLSNAFDESNLLDRISSQLAEALGMRDTPDGEFVNVYLNGTYNGLYFLSQRVRTGGSVHIDKLNDRILEANIKSSRSTVSKNSASADGNSEDNSPSDDSSEDASPSYGSPEGGSTEGGSSEDSSSGNTWKGMRLPKKVDLSEEEDGSLQRWAYEWPNEPADNSGGYLLQVHERYNGKDCWFNTEHKRFRITSPSYPTVGEVEYLQDYLLTAERAIYSEDGVDPETGTSYDAILDMPSWEDMFLLEELFVEWDAERWSFFITKDRRDPLLYCGPMWDFDHSAGTLLYGNYPETAVSTLLFTDDRSGWMNQLLSHESFSESVKERWKTRFSPALHSYLEGDGSAGGSGEAGSLGSAGGSGEAGSLGSAGGSGSSGSAGGSGDSGSGSGLFDKKGSRLSIDREIAAISTSADMNNIRRSNTTVYTAESQRIKDWLTRRLAFLDDYFEHPDNYCRVVFKFKWGSLSHYVLKGETLGFLPLPEYGETQIPSQIQKNEILGWKDEDGNAIGAEIVIDKDRTFKPVYRE